MYQVVWLQTALDELAAAWTNADSSIRQEITLAAQEVDRQLQSKPDTRGESRAKGWRIVFVYPLAVVFEVDSQHLLVRVIHTWCFRRRGHA